MPEFLPSNILRILSVEGSSALTRNFVQELRLGMLLEGRVLELLSAGKIAVNFQGQEAVVDIENPPPPGQTFTARVERVNPTPVLKVLPRLPSARSPEIPPENPKTNSKTPEAGFTTRLTSRRFPPLGHLTQRDLDYLKLRSGQELQVKILRLMNPETALAQSQGRDFLVRLTAPQSVRPGNLLSVSVERISHQLTRLIQAGGPPTPRVDAEMIKPYLPTFQDFAGMTARLEKAVAELASLGERVTDPALLDRLRQTLALLAPKSGKVPNAAQIKEQVDHSGLDYEARVKEYFEDDASPAKKMGLGRNLKGQLLELIHNLERHWPGKDAGAGPISHIKDSLITLRQGLDNIELHQLANQFARQENQPIYLQIPNPFAPGDKSIRLFVRLPAEEDSGEKKKGKRVYRLTFLLNLSRLGNLRVDSQVHGQDLSVTLQAEQKPVADFIESRSPEFQTQMAGYGFNTHVTCCVRDKVERDADQEGLPLFIDGNSKLVDIRT